MKLARKQYEAPCQIIRQHQLDATLVKSYATDFCGVKTLSETPREHDDKNLVGLRGVIKISHTVVNSTSLLNLDGFAPASEWEQVSSSSPASLAVWEASK